jgi:hypothetical protein
MVKNAGAEDEAAHEVGTVERDQQEHQRLALAVLLVVGVHVTELDIAGHVVGALPCAWVVRQWARPRIFCCHNPPDPRKLIAASFGPPVLAATDGHVMCRSPIP